MSLEVKIIAGLVGIIVFLGALFFGFRAIYDAGDNAGASRVQLQWDDDKANIQKITDAAIASVTKERDTALQANEAIQNAYQTQLSAANANAADFAARLRSAESRLAASSRGMPQGGGGSGITPASANAGDVVLTNAIGSALAECQANSAQLNALIAEIKPQLQ
jgi:preprotein translocase subunit SecF